MTVIANVTKGSDGRFYISPLSAQLNGLSWSKKDDAEYICRAVNAAYNRGREDVQRELRDLLNVPERSEGDD